MSRALVVGSSAPTKVSSPGTRGAKKRNVAALSTIAEDPIRPSSSRRKASVSAGASSSAGDRASSAGPSTTRTRPRKVSAGDVSGPVAPPSPAPKTAKTRKASTPGASAKKEKPEKRLSKFLANPSAATSERIARAFQQRLYLIDKRFAGDDSGSPTSCNFNVLGSTGNVYEVQLQQRPSCTCPDFPRSGLCKHILFVMLRVLKLDRNDPRVWQKALLTSELRELLDISSTSDGALASESVRYRFRALQSGSGTSEGTSALGDEQPKSVQREIDGDCPICYEKMDDGKRKAKEPVVFCRVCGNNVHRDCFQKWSRSKSSSGGKATCIYCRAEWSEGQEKTTKPKKYNADYVNLSDVSEAHRTLPSSLEDLYPESHMWFGRSGRRLR